MELLSGYFKVQNLHLERSEVARQNDAALSAASAENYVLQSELEEVKEQLSLKQAEGCQQKEAAGLQQGQASRRCNLTELLAAQASSRRKARRTSGP